MLQCLLCCDEKSRTQKTRHILQHFFSKMKHLQTINVTNKRMKLFDFSRRGLGIHDAHTAISFFNDLVELNTLRTPRSSSLDDVSPINRICLVNMCLVTVFGCSCWIFVHRCTCFHFPMSKKMNTTAILTFTFAFVILHLYGISRNPSRDILPSKIHSFN